MALFIIEGFKFRSSACSNVSFSTYVIPLNLFWYHFFLKSWWIGSNFVYYTENKPQNFSDLAAQDTYEARYVFPIFYFGSWGGLLFALLCIYRAGLTRSYDFKDTVKFYLYAVFLVSGFLWCLQIDGTIYHNIVSYQLGIIITHIICLVTALIIGIISIIQKHSEGDLFYTRHLNYTNWNKLDNTISQQF